MHIVNLMAHGVMEEKIYKQQIKGFKMNLIYYNLYQATRLEKFVTAYGQFLKSNGEQPVMWKRAATMEDVLREADVSLMSETIPCHRDYLVSLKRGRLSFKKFKDVAVKVATKENECIFLTTTKQENLQKLCQENMLFLADVNTQLKNKNITADVKVDTNSNGRHPVWLKYVEQELAKKRGKSIDATDQTENDLQSAEDELYVIPKHLKLIVNRWDKALVIDVGPGIQFYN